MFQLLLQLQLLAVSQLQLQLQCLFLSYCWISVTVAINWNHTEWQIKDRFVPFRCHLRSVPVNLPAPFEDILIPLLLQHCLIMLVLTLTLYSGPRGGVAA